MSIPFSPKISYSAPGILPNRGWPRSQPGPLESSDSTCVRGFPFSALRNVDPGELPVLAPLPGLARLQGQVASRLRDFQPKTAGAEARPPGRETGEKTRITSV